MTNPTPRENTMNSVFLNRFQYDYLVQNCPNWMELHWKEYSKQWGIGGVIVAGSESAIENLKYQLA